MRDGALRAPYPFLHSFDEVEFCRVHEMHHRKHQRVPNPNSGTKQCSRSIL